MSRHIFSGTEEIDLSAAKTADRVVILLQVQTLDGSDFPGFREPEDVGCLLPIYVGAVADALDHMTLRGC